MTMNSSAPDPVSATLGHRPGKVIAVHVSYRSRAAQRGRTPEHPSYFLKTPSSLTGSEQVVRPKGTELLGFEGEIALVIDTPAARVDPQQAWGHVGWVTAANDLGLHDLRYGDKGSNVRSKCGDGYTPIGPRLLPAAQVDPGRLRLRTWLDENLVQEDTTEGLLFGFGLLIAELSRVMTLERGDVSLTGAPAGASVAHPGQRITVEVTSLDDETRTTGLLRTSVIEGPELAPWGSPPMVDDAQRADAWGHPAKAQSPGPQSPVAQSSGPHAAAAQASGEASAVGHRHGHHPAAAAGRPETGAGAAFELTADLRRRLSAVAVATLSVQLRRRGFDTVTLDGLRPLVPGRGMVGRARTLRYVSYRKDLFADHGGGYNAQKQVIDTLRPGEVLVMEARGDATAGTLGDILALRAQVRGAAGVITDGAVRDYRAAAQLDLPVFAGGAHPAVLGRRHVPWEADVTISCGGATVQVGDVVVADDDGALVIPPHLVVEVLQAAEIQEAEEEFIAEMVARGEDIEGLYPMSEHWHAQFEQWQAGSSHQERTDR